MEQLTPSPPIANQNFGYRLDFEGDDLVAAWHDDLQGYKAGALTYLRSAASGTWQVQATHRDPHGNPRALFGSSMDIDAGQLLVSAPGAQSEAERRGGAFLRDLSQPPPRVWALPVCFGDSTCRCHPTAQFQRTVGCPNGVGDGAFLDACGSPSLNSDDLGFSARELPPMSLALLFMGTPQAALPFNDGTLCVTQAGVVFMAQANLAGGVVFPSGTLGQAAALLGPAYSAQAGQSWTFQVAYTDPDPPACLGPILQLVPARMNQTPALVVTVAP